MKVQFIVLFFMGVNCAWSAEDILKLKVGFVHKISCNGKLYVSAVGNDGLVRLEALPKELGCAVILKPTGLIGTTNLIMETSTGTIEKMVEITSR
jgi:hypothetical protein